MIAALMSLIPWDWLAIAGAGLVAVIAAWFGGSRSQKLKAENKTLKAEIKAKERVKNADTGIGATDLQRIERLQRYADEHKRNQ